MKLRDGMIGILTICMAGSLFAGPKPDSYTDHERRFRSSEDPIRRTKGQHESRMWDRTNLSARGCPVEQGFFLSLDFLYWRAQNHGFPYVYDQQESNLNTTFNNISSIGKYIRISQQWKPGFRIGIGWNTPHGEWDVLLNWTYYHNLSTDSVSRDQRAPTDLIDGLHPLWVSALIAGNAYGNAFGLWRLNHNIIDAELGRAYFNSRYLTFRPFFGVRAAWLYQDFAVRLREGFAGGTIARDGNAFGEDNYWGVGPRAGMKANWTLGSGFHIFGLVSGSLLYGNVDAVLIAAAEEPDGSLTFVPITDIRDSYSQVCPTVQSQLGLEWGRCFQDRFFLALNIGWEVNYYWNRMNLAQKIITPNPIVFPTGYNKPVTMEGITFSAKLDF